MSQVVGVIILILVVAFFGFQIFGLIKDIKNRKACKKNNSEEHSENTSKEDK